VIQEPSPKLDIEKLVRFNLQDGRQPSTFGQLTALLNKPNDAGILADHTVGLYAAYASVGITFLVVLMSMKLLSQGFLINKKERSLNSAPYLI
jgi:hypothetical protein